MNATARRFPSHRALAAHDWHWPDFTPAEMAAPSGELVLVPAFMDWLQYIREVFDRPMIISAGTRTPLRQFELTGRRRGAHVDGEAADVLVSGQDAMRLLSIALNHGAGGIGVQQSGPHRSRYLHLDRWSSAPAGTRPALWSY